MILETGTSNNNNERTHNDIGVNGIRENDMIVKPKTNNNNDDTRNDISKQIEMYEMTVLKSTAL